MASLPSLGLHWDNGTAGPRPMWSLILQEANPGLFTRWWRSSRSQEWPKPNTQAFFEFLLVSCLITSHWLNEISHVGPTGGEIDSTSWLQEWHSHIARGLAYRNGKNLWPFAIYPSHKFSKWPERYWNLGISLQSHTTLLEHVMMIFFGYLDAWDFFFQFYIMNMNYSEN